MNLESVKTPCFIVQKDALRRNLDILAEVKKRTGCRILLALKGFAMFRVFPMLREVLDGTCASSPHEARLGFEEFGGEVHSFAAALSTADMDALLQTSDHITFNSFAQWQRFKPLLAAAPRHIECGLRINPGHSEAPVALYDPCAPRSRLGIVREAFDGESLEGITGLHFHTLCEQNADALERTLAAVTRQFDPFIRQMKWMNFGGGHHITRPDYNVDLLCRLISAFKEEYGVEVYLEPGEAVALNAGVLASRVLDIVHNEIDIAILDTSAATHMPDVLEMPYRPEIEGAGKPGELPCDYRLAGVSCLAGDIIGDYSFPRPLQIGDILQFQDMAHYSMVKTTTFNGIQLPSIALFDSGQNCVTIVKEFGYDDFKHRLS